jgi:glycosyltransferase involved in cell wall biosynthesis
LPYYVIKKKNICFLASIFPNKLDAFEGDFVLRHAEAISLLHKVTVLFAIETDLVQEPQVEEEQLFTQLRVIRIYLPIAYKKLLNKWRYYAVLKEKFMALHQEFPFDIIHANVHWRSGYLAYKIHKAFPKIPYVISEHLGYFNKDYYREEAVHYYPLVKRFISRKVLNQAAMVLPVSDYLGKWIKDFAPKAKLTTVSNAVNTEYFNYKDDKKANTKFRFVHASMLSVEKNIYLILEAIKILGTSRSDFEFHFYTPKMKFIEDFIQENNFQEIVVQHGLVSHQQMPAIYNNADCNVLYSTLETQGCVVLESLCCGLPNICTYEGALDALITKDNGLKGDAHNAQKLADLMRKLLDKEVILTPEKIAAQAQALYSYAAIAQQFNSVYEGL